MTRSPVVGEPNVSGRYRYAVLAAATLGFFTYVFVQFSYPPMAEAVRTELRLTFTEFGLVLAVFALTYLLFQIPGGVLSDRFGGAPLVYGGLILMGSSAFIFPLFATFPCALTSRLLMGVGAGLLMPAAVKLIATHFDSERLNLAMGIFGSALGLTQIAVFVTIPLVTFGGNWRNGVYLAGVFALSTAVITYLLLRRAKTPQTKMNPRVKIGFRDVMSRRLIALTLPNFAGLAVIVRTIAWTPLFLSNRLDLAEIDSGLIVAIIGVTNIAASWAGGLVATRLGPKLVIMVSAILGVVLPSMFIFATSVPVALAIVAGIGWATMFYFGPILALVPYLVPKGQEPSSAVLGAFNTLSNLGQFVSPIARGMILDLTRSFELAFIALSAIAVLGVLGTAFLRTGSASESPPGKISPQFL